MLFKNLRPFVLIIRPVNCLGTFSLVIISTYAAMGQNFPVIPALLGGLGVALNAGAGSVINDYFDVEADRVNQLGRMLPAGQLSRREALRYYLVLSALSAGVLGLVNLWALLVGVGMSLLLFVYSWKLREISGVVSNLAIAFSLGMMLAFGAVITGHISKLIVLFFVFGVYTGFVRELIGDIADLEGDRIGGRLKTLPITRGVTKSTIIALQVLFVSTMFLTAPFLRLPYLAQIGSFLTSALLMSFTNRRVMYGELAEAQRGLKVGFFIYPAIVVLAGFF